MVLLVSGATRTMSRLCENPETRRWLGRFRQPRCGTPIGGQDPQGLIWAADNDAFGTFDAARFVRMLQNIEKGGLFVTCPDVMGNHEETLELWDLWSWQIREFNQIPAFVAQDGCTSIDQCPAACPIFIGGTNAFKDSSTAIQIARDAHL